MSQPIEIQRKAVEHDIAVVKGRIGLQKAVLAGHLRKAIAERALVGEVAMRAFAPIPLAELREWFEAHRQEAEARENIIRLELAQLESQVTLWEAMLRQGDTNIIEPGGFRA